MSRFSELTNVSICYVRSRDRKPSARRSMVLTRHWLRTEHLVQRWYVIGQGEGERYAR